ncbi:hypothetical protein KFL_001600270 [Klebsormidium nitens]|uniref:RRM domain-containing protein n=1 Tax=Klebsormidium nitens TaxID=105231 RepID=A0A1Y1I4V9_KLENI|nr:hypothetical protein KFL_001600270 [Klebsormidium nitens]|eukprot:GAQ83757.1 hypothetical protein KFL_001600270 [Klebsormidium nitens]
MAVAFAPAASVTSCGGGCFNGGGRTSVPHPALPLTSLPATYAIDKFFGQPCGTRLVSSAPLSRAPFLSISEHGLRLVRSPGGPQLRALKERFADLNLGGDVPDDDMLEDGSFLLAQDLERRPAPRGFGQGTVYDTSVEDALMRDLEAGRAGLKKPRQAGDAPAVARSEPGSGRKKRPPLPPPAAHSGPFPWLLRGTPEDKYPPNTPAGVKVAVGNLPRKKKVGRDLRKALAAVPGLLVIRPAEEGDRDTRDCTCKGSATLIFEDQQYAAGFCTSFQGRAIQFGKIERRITAKLADKRQQLLLVEASAVNDEDSDEDEEDDVDELIEEGRKKGAEQLQQQRTLEEEAGRHALLEGSPPHDEAELQAATVKSPKEAPPAQAAPDRSPATNSESRRVDQLAAGKALPASKDGEDGRSAALSGNVAEAGGARAGPTLARAVQLAAAADKDAEKGEGENIDDLFDDEDLADAALDDDGDEEEGEWDEEAGAEWGEEDEDGDWEEDEEDGAAEVEISDCAPGEELAPRSARVTKLLDDGTLIVRGQEVGRVDPRAAKDGQLPVPEEVAARIAEVTGGAAVEVELVTESALAQKRAFEEKLVAWHFGQLPGFQGAERPSQDDVTVTWDSANRTMVRGGGFDKAKHKRLKKLQREPQNVQELVQGRGGAGAQAERDTSRSDMSDEEEGAFELDDEFEEEEWVLDESDDEGEEEAEGARSARSSGGDREGGAGPSASVKVPVGKLDYRELLAAEKRELAAGIARLKAAGKAVPEPSPEVLELVSALLANPGMFDDDDEEEQAAPAKKAGSGRPGRGPRSGQARGGKPEGESRQREGSQSRPANGAPESKKSRNKRPSKPQYGKLIANLPKTL